MHVLPLPFGLALALIPRREADRFDDGPTRSTAVLTSSSAAVE